ncbi:hypothetical protein AVEN_17827-1, partial [Araneus ventricosus]
MPIRPTRKDVRPGMGRQGRNSTRAPQRGHVK